MQSVGPSELSSKAKVPNYDIEVILNFLGGRDKSEIEENAKFFGMNSSIDRRTKKYHGSTPPKIVRLDLLNLEDLKNSDSEVSQQLRALNLRLYQF